MRPQDETATRGGGSLRRRGGQAAHAAPAIKTRGDRSPGAHRLFAGGIISTVDKRHTRRRALITRPEIAVVLAGFQSFQGLPERHGVERQFSGNPAQSDVLCLEKRQETCRPAFLAHFCPPTQLFSPPPAAHGGPKSNDTASRNTRAVRAPREMRERRLCRHDPRASETEKSSLCQHDASSACICLTDVDCAHRLFGGEAVNWMRGVKLKEKWRKECYSVARGAIIWRGQV
jgi:hypothetical protein